jgi:hypothetical protein
VGGKLKCEACLLCISLEQKFPQQLSLQFGEKTFCAPCEESLAQFSLPSFSQTNQVVELFLEKIKFNLIKLYLVLGYFIKKDGKL